MRILSSAVAAFMLVFPAVPAFADEEAPPAQITVHGHAELVSDYRNRGVSLSGGNAAIQADISVHHRSGLYVSVWGSSVDRHVIKAVGVNGEAGIASTELHFNAGYAHSFGSTSIDVGGTYYVFPKTKRAGDQTSSDFVEIFAGVGQKLGIASLKATALYVPKQKALAFDQIGPKRDNLYLTSAFSLPVPKSPISLDAHYGHNLGSRGYGDWSMGASLDWKALTIGVHYVDTDGTFTSPSSTKNLGGATVVGSISAHF